MKEARQAMQASRAGVKAEVDGGGVTKMRKNKKWGSDFLSRWNVIGVIWSVIEIMVIIWYYDGGLGLSTPDSFATIETRGREGIRRVLHRRSSDRDKSWYDWLKTKLRIKTYSV